MTTPDRSRIPLSRSQQNLYNGVLQDSDPALYLIGKTYRFRAVALSGFLAALTAAISESPVQLCVLQSAGSDYPDLVPGLQVGDLVRVRVRSRDQQHDEPDDDDLKRSWSAGILDKPLVRYTVWTDGNGEVSGLDVYTHHIVVDGGATGIIEADLARHLTSGSATETRSVADGLLKLAGAHRREAAKVEQSLQRVADTVQRELADDARLGGPGHVWNDAPGSAAKGVLKESVTLSGTAFDAVLALSEAKQVPLNVLVATAAAAVYASLRQSTESLLVHAVDNRFGDPDLNVATCLVNSVGHSVRFAPFASVQDVARALDKGYVKAVRRRWLREEHYRRMYLAINRTSHVEALTLNFIRESCAPGLRPFLVEAPVATDIGPVEGMTVASVLDERERSLNLAIWDRADQPEWQAQHRVAERIAAALTSMAALWDQPIAMAVDEWVGISPDGQPCRGGAATPTPQPAVPAWFLDATGGVETLRRSRACVFAWIAWLVRNGVVPGDVVVCTDDDTDTPVDLLIACHLAGCGYSICQPVDDVTLRANAIADQLGDGSVHVVDVAAVLPAEGVRAVADGRIAEVTRDTRLATRTAYIMPTSGTTGQPKLVRITHGSLALFCAAARQAYGWGPSDTVLQCAPLTSDISVEEIFGAAICGSKLVRSTATRTGDLDALARDIVVNGATVVDLPTAIWHVLCEDSAAMNAIRGSRLRQIVIGGEAVRPGAVDKWTSSTAAQAISLVSSYGPTESTVVVTYLPIARGGTAVAESARRRVGRPIVPDTVFLAFGEVVIVGDLVSTGYLGTDDRNFGLVTGRDGTRHRAFATADRIQLDADGFPVFAGRKDAVVKISGKRVDIAVLTRNISADPAVSDVAVELHDGRFGRRLGVWFETPRTRESAADAAVSDRIRFILLSSGVSAFFVVGVPNIPRKPNGKVDSDTLRALPGSADAARDDAECDERAAGLAHVWSRHLETVLRPDSSLLDAGIGSLDLIRILPDTRTYLNRHLTILDLISADTAANLIADLGSAATTADTWMDGGTAAEIERDLDELWHQAPTLSTAPHPGSGADRPIIVLGASGILGTGFAGAVLDLKQSGVRCPEVILASRSKLPQRGPWGALRAVKGVRITQLSADFDAPELEALIRETGAGTVVNCIGNTNVLVPYRELRAANVDLASATARTCADHGVRLVHLSTYVVNAEVTAPQVTDPRAAPYPYAASKSLAELAVVNSPRHLDYTLVRLPRILGEDYQLRNSADILVAVADACVAVGAHPALALTEEVTTGRAAATAILGLLPEIGGAAVPGPGLGRGITVARGAAVDYAKLLSEFAADELEVAEWKHRLDESDWATSNPRRWSVVDAWLSLGMRLGGRSYTEFLADYPTIDLGVEAVAELAAPPESVRALLQHGISATAPIASPAL